MVHKVDNSEQLGQYPHEVILRTTLLRDAINSLNNSAVFSTAVTRHSAASNPFPLRPYFVNGQSPGINQSAETSLYVDSNSADFAKVQSSVPVEVRMPVPENKEVVDHTANQIGGAIGSQLDVRDIQSSLDQIYAEAGQ